jgi:chromosomal replication initiator protein
LATFLDLLGTFSLDGTAVTNGVLTIPLSGTSLDRLQPGSAAPRLSGFIAGAENALAHAALLPLVDIPIASGTPSVCNPIVLYGPHGSGKTHLACGLADRWRERFPRAAVACLSAVEFARQYAGALDDGRLDAWREEIRRTDLFILEDLGQITGKQPAQLELVHTLDALLDREALIVVTARTLPNHWTTLLPALRSRLSAALTVPLSYPERATRRVILEQLAEARHLPLSGRALDGLVDGVTGGVPLLGSAILELELSARLDGESIDQARVKKLVAERDTAAEPSLRDIARLTAKYFGLKLSDLKGPHRQRSLVAGRCVAMFLARELTACSLSEIGEFFGGRDHTTVLHGCRRTEQLLKRDTAVRQAIADVKKMLAAT